jgi:hypothetical protein
MARPSTIEQLPPDILEQLQALLRDPRVSQMDATAEINAILQQMGHPERVSKSAVNRYSQRMEEVGSRLRQSRAVAEMWIGKLGAEPQGKVGHLLNEIVRTLAFESAMHFAEGEDPIDPKSLKELAIAVHRLEQAAGDAVKREKEIREQVQKEAAEVAAKVAKQGGLSADSVQELRRAILGVKS